MQDVKAAHVLLTTKMAQLSGSVAATIWLNSVFFRTLASKSRLLQYSQMKYKRNCSCLQFPETGPTQLSG